MDLVIGIEVIGVLGGLILGGLLGLLTPVPEKNNMSEAEPVPVPIPVDDEPKRNRED